MESSLLPPPQPWSTAQKILFRFGFLFVIFFIFFKPNQSYTIGLYNFYIQPFIRPIQWLARHLLHISHPVEFYDGSDGGADDLFDYLSLFVVFVLSIAGTIIWSLLDRKPRNYRILQYWFTAIIRYYLALSMFDYGLAKIFMVQFAEATPGQLADAYGMTSPMGLAWKFFGYSRGYNYFLGFGELLGAALLLFRRTARLGAIVMLVVTINVMAVNYFYDVVVKEISTMLVIMSLILLLQDYRHHAAFFIFNRQTEPGLLYKPRFRKKTINTSFVILKYLVIVIPFVLAYQDIREAAKTYGPNVPRPAIFGIYDADIFIKNKDTLTPLTTDAFRWRKFIVGNRGTAIVKMMNDSTRSFLLISDSVSRSISMSSRDSSRRGRFNYTLSPSGTLSLHGIWSNRNKTDSLDIIMKRVDLNNYRLVRSKMHFINELSTNY